jgi:hypothetical protein
MVPHRRCYLNWGDELTPRCEVRADHPTDATNLVADNTPLFTEEFCSSPHVSSGIEVVERVQEGNEITRLLLGKVRLVDSELTHPLDHARAVIPHRGG